jgi:hypothetical protein
MIIGFPMALFLAGLPPLRALLVGIILGGVALGGMLWSLSATDEEAQPIPFEPVEFAGGSRPLDPSGDVHPLSHLGKGIIPVWAQQAEIVRHQTEQAIAGLTTEFSSMQNELRQAVSGGGVGNAQRVTTTIATGKSVLEGIVKALQEAQESRNHLMDRIGEMTQTIKLRPELSVSPSR